MNMNRLKILDESLFVVSTYMGIMWDEQLWVMMFEDANASKDKVIKQRALNMERLNINLRKIYVAFVQFDKQRNLLNKFPFKSMIKDEDLDCKFAGYDAANDAFRLLLILRKINPRPLYHEKISELKFLIDKNVPGRY